MCIQGVHCITVSLSVHFASVAAGVFHIHGLLGIAPRNHAQQIRDRDNLLCLQSRAYYSAKLHGQNWQGLYLAILSIRVSCPKPIGHSQCSSPGSATSHPSVVFCTAAVPEAKIQNVSTMPQLRFIPYNNLINMAENWKDSQKLKFLLVIAIMSNISGEYYCSKFTC